MLLEHIILECAEKFSHKRTDSAIFHLLTGRKSTQTIQDVHLFQLKNYYGIYPALRRDKYNEIIRKLIKAELIRVKNTQIVECLVSKLNDDYREEKTYFSGLDYIQISQTFYRRLLIFIQVYTNKRKANRRYIPVIEQQEILAWIKTYLKRNKQESTLVLNSLFQEMKSALKQIKPVFTNVFIDRLTSYKKYGLSEAQLSYKYKLPLADIALIITATNHRMIKLILENPSEYNILYSLLDDLTQKSFMTKSAEFTYQLWKQGKNIQDIVKIRKIKENTVFDHFIEIALNTPSFPIENFVSTKQQSEIIKASQANKTKKLKDIKEVLHQDISYFQISLTLARKNYLTY